MRLVNVLIFFILILQGNLSFAQIKHELKEKDIYKSLNYHRDNSNRDSAIYFADKLIEFNLNSGEEKDLVRSYYQKIRTLRIFGLYDESLALALFAQSKYCSSDNMSSNNCGPCLHVYREMLHFSISIEDYRLGIHYLDMICDSKKDEQYYYDKANLYRLLNLSDSALIMAKDGVSWAVLSGKHRAEMRAQNNFGLIAKKIGEYTTAISAFLRAIELGEQNNIEKHKFAHIYGNLGSCYYVQGNYDEAYRLLEIDANGSLINNAISSFINAQITLALIDYTNNRFSRVIDRLGSLNNTYQDQFENVERIRIFELLAKANKRKGNTSEYERFLNLLLELKDDDYKSQLKKQSVVIRKYAENSMTLVTKKMKLEKDLAKQKFQIKLKDQEKKHLINRVFIISLVFSIILIIVFFIRFRVNQKRKLILKEVRINSERQKQELLRLKIKQEAQNVEALSLELKLKNDFSKVLTEKLKTIQNISHSDIKNIELFVQNEMAIKSTRAELNEQMGSLSGQFYNSLLTKHKNLTDVEIRLAALVVMNMTNKDISISKNITAASVKVAKNRLKKKLGLLPHENLKNYLKQFF